VLVEDGRLRLSRGPRENRFRPPVDPLFRTAATAHGKRVIGIVLSGMLSDGAHVLMAIKHHGGIAIVQDAREAMCPSMPLSAIAKVEVDHVARVAEMPALLVRHVGETASTARKDAAMAGKSRGRGAGGTNGDEREIGSPAAYACPDCGGALWEVDPRCASSRRTATSFAPSRRS
jgi:two-component system chemotaxis response regulator CheB